MDVGRFPVDLVLFGMIAVFLILRLRSILGRRTGFERPPAANFQPPPNGQQGATQGPIIEGRAEPVPVAPPRPLPDPASPIGGTLERMKSIDRTFDPAEFLAGAEKAFRIIVSAFAEGDRAAFRKLVGEEVYNSFDLAVSAREAAGHTQVSDVKSIVSATIDNVFLRGSVAQVVVRFVSDQVSMTKDRTGHPIEGTDAVTEITDVWTFERDLSGRDPTWRLVAVASG
jgi:predicted lipid-binding transport protein (Tim44 family)